MVLAALNFGVPINLISQFDLGRKIVPLAEDYISPLILIIICSIFLYTFNPRVNLRSDNVVQYYEPKIVCGLCEREGHSQVSCDYASCKVGENMSYEDYVFWSYVDPIDRPEGFM